MKVLGEINRAKAELDDILDCIKRKEPDAEIMDSFQDISMGLLRTLKSIDHTLYNFMFDVIRKDLDPVENLTDSGVKAYLYRTFQKYFDKKLLQFISDLIAQDYQVFNARGDIPEESEPEPEPEPALEPEILEDDQPIEELIEKFSWRSNQLKAIEKVKEQGWISGIHNQIMGAGKSLIMLKMISEHLELHPTNIGIYVVLCFRKEILNGMFDFQEDGTPNKKKIKLWRDNGVIDLDKFNIIDRVNKKTRIVKHDSTKPSVLIINTDYLRSLHNLNKSNEKAGIAPAFDYKLINFVILDESHGISAKELFNILEEIRYTHCKHIIGLSATPLRDGAEKKLLRIFSPDGKNLNIISNYDFMCAMSDGVILPPHITIGEVNKTLKGRIGTSNKDIITRILTNRFSQLPYGKILCWCRTIKQMKEYYRFLAQVFPDYKVFCSSYANKSMGQSGLYNIDDGEFFKMEGKAIMVCVNKFREGSDIYHLDCVIYMDRVRHRTILVSMQTSGRVLRPDKEKRKTHGYIIDTFINDGKVQVEILTAQSILKYYSKILSISEQSESIQAKKQQYAELSKKISESFYDEDKQELTIRLDNDPTHDTKIKLELTTKKFDWVKLRGILTSELDKKYEVTKQDKFNQIIEKIKEIKKFSLDIDFWKEYKKLPYIELGIPEIDQFKEEYNDIWDKTTWYMALGHTHYWNLEILREEIQKKFKSKVSMSDKIYSLMRKLNPGKLPAYPFEYYRLSNITTYSDMIPEH